MVRHAFYVLLSIALAGGTARAQGAQASFKTVERLAPPLGCDHVTVEDGLPHTNVTAIAQDQMGFVWFGTGGGGLGRYDGLQMYVYRPKANDPASVSSGFITSLAVGADGKLWVGTPDAGVSRWDPKTNQFTRFDKDKLGSDGVTAIARDRKDRMWLAINGSGLVRFDPATSELTDYNDKPLDVGITSISVDAKGHLWLGTATPRVIRWNPDDGSSQVFELAPGNQAIADIPVKAVIAASTGKVFVGTNGAGLFVLDPGTGKIVEHHHSATDPATLTADEISVLFEDTQHVVWIGTLLGLNRLDPSGSIIRFQNDPDDRNNKLNLPFPEVQSIYQDAGGVMWVGGFTNGVCKFDESRQQFGLYATKTHALSFFEDPDGTLWVGTYAGLYKIERAAQRVTIYRALGTNRDGQESLNLDAVWITALHRDRKGTMWVAMKDHGIVAFDTATETHRHYMPDPEDAASLPSETVFDVWEAPDGSLLLATWGAGLVRLDPAAETFAVIADDKSDVGSNALYKLYPDPGDPSVVWIGTLGAGVARLNLANNAVKSFRHSETDPSSLSKNDVTSIYRDAAGTVWVGTFGGGLNRLDAQSGKAERFDTSNSELTNNEIFNILPDAQGKLWLATNGGGLVSFDPSIKPQAKAFMAYTSADGAQHNEFAQTSAMLGKDGTLYFGGQGGFNAFKAQNIKRDTYVPPIVVTGYKVGNREGKLDRPIWTLPTLELSYSDSFELQFASLAFAAPKQNRYQYKLDGYDDDWGPITDRPFKTYEKLGGGKYTLRVRASNRHGVWNETPLTLNIKVAPPFWRSWPAFVIYILLVLAAAFGLYRLQRERLKKAQREGRLAVVERDLALTGAVQTSFLPQQSEVSSQNLQLVGLYRPADACGGDWWWHETLPSGRRVVMVGDVTGHGPGPAMVTAAVATAFRVLLETGIEDVKDVLEALNREVLRVGRGKYHMTMAALEIDEATGQWIFHSAGGPPIMALRPNGKHRVVFCPGAPLGTENDFEVGRIQGTFKPTERMLLYTDGIPEIELPTGGALGMRRFAQFYEATRNQHLRDAANTLMFQADRTQAGQPQADDWTFTMIEWNDGREVTMSGESTMGGGTLTGTQV